MMFVNSLTRLLAAAGLLMSGAACTFLPAAGPTSAQITAAATSANETGFTIVDVTPAVLAELGKIKPPTFIGRFPIGGISAPRVIGIGDALSISIWEAGDGGLFSPGAAGSIVVGGSRQTQLPPTLVDRTGEITVPYAGRIRVAGRTPREVEQAIVEKLGDRAIQPQAVVNIHTNTANTVNVLGDIGGGQIPLTQRDDRLLDVIAMAGGAKSPAYDTLVRLTRGNVTGTVSLQRVISDPRENISIKPGDTIVLLRSPQTFTSFGASNSVAQVPFEAETISLAEAMARVGGPNDQRADAAAVFLFRFEEPTIAQALSQGAAAGVGRVPLVYRIDLRSAEGYFYAQTFPVRDKDTIYVANAAAYDLSKFFTFIRSGTAVATDVAATRVLYSR
jgi:polysaccharide export outer membrane protein